MKKVNPLFLLFSTLALVFIAIFSLTNEKQKNIETIEQYKELQKIALEYELLNNHYKNIDFIANKIEKIVKKSNIRDVKINKKRKILEIEVINKDKKNLDRFINKLFNMKLSITKIQFDGIKFSFKVGAS